MKTIRLKLLALMWVIGIASPIASQAYYYDFKFDGICYNILSEEDRTVEVAEPYQFVKGHISISPKVIYNSKSYSVTAIGEGAFYECSGLTSVDIPSSVTTIGDRAFIRCSGLTSVDIPSSVTSIGASVFYDCYRLTSVNIPSSVTSIGESAFYRCSGLTSVDIPSSVTTIGSDAFSYCYGLTSVDIPSSVTSIGESAFYGCSGLTSVDIPSSVTSIGASVFYDCYRLTSVNIPSSVTSIGESAFYRCSGLTSVDIPSSVTKIGDYAFSGVGLEKIYCHWEKPIKISALVFGDKCLMNSILYVPIGTKAEYEKVDPWRNFWNIEEIDYESMSGVSDITHSSGDDIEEVTRWDVSGKHVSKDYKGLVIVRYSDGSTKKYINR